MNCCKALFSVIILASALMPESSAEDARQKINFFRPSEPGNVLISNIESEAASTSVLTSLDGGKSEKKSVNRMAIEGIMTVKTVTAYGRPSRIEFKVEKVKGDINGQEVKFTSDRKTLEIDLEGTPCGFRIKDGKDEIGKNEILLLSLVFRKTRKETLADFIGTENEIKVGDTWKTPFAPLEGEFAKRGINIKDLLVGGNVNFTGRKEIHGFDCWVFDAKLKAEKGDEFSFEFQAEVCLPCDGKTGAVKMSRTGSERVVKKIADKNNPVMPDVKEASITITDKMNILMIPQGELGK
ncbi:MAG: hypothetical protein WC637_02835 [Victivallales bacterium]